MNSCDECNDKCKYLTECLESSYNEMLRRCNVDIKETPPESPEVSQNAKEQGMGEGIKFERIRRCTGYLSGDYQTRFNDAKKAEVEDRMSSSSFRRTEQYHES